MSSVPRLALLLSIASGAMACASSRAVPISPGATTPSVASSVAATVAPAVTVVVADDLAYACLEHAPLADGMKAKKGREDDPFGELGYCLSKGRLRGARVALRGGSAGDRAVAGALARLGVPPSRVDVVVDDGRTTGSVGLSVGVSPPGARASGVSMPLSPSLVAKTAR